MSTNIDKTAFLCYIEGIEMILSSLQPERSLVKNFNLFSIFTLLLVTSACGDDLHGLPTDEVGGEETPPAETPTTPDVDPSFCGFDSKMTAGMDEPLYPTDRTSFTVEDGKVVGHAVVTRSDFSVDLSIVTSTDQGSSPMSYDIVSVAQSGESSDYVLLTVDDIRADGSLLYVLWTSNTWVYADEYTLVPFWRHSLTTIDLAHGTMKTDGLAGLDEGELRQYMMAVVEGGGHLAYENWDTAEIGVITLNDVDGHLSMGETQILRGPVEGHFQTFISFEEQSGLMTFVLALPFEGNKVETIRYRACQQ